MLRRLFDKSKFAISTEETRYYLNGVYMHVAEGDGRQVLRCVATDGHRLARIDADLPDGAEGMPGVIVPRKTVGELRKLLDDDDARDRGVGVETKVRFATPGDHADLEGHRRHLPRLHPRHPAEQRPPAGGRRGRVRPRRRPGRDGVVRTQPRGEALLDEDRLVLSVNAPDSGAAEEELAVAYGDEQLEIGFNAKYLLEIASQVDRENAVFLFNSSRRSRR